MATWTITSMNCIFDINGMKDVVKEVSFLVDDLIHGKVELPEPQGSFLPYNELTQENVVDWVKSVLTDSGVSSYEEMANQLKAPPATGYKALPW
jgi:hypothetical protein